MIYSKKIDTPIGEALVCAIDGGVCFIGFTDNKNLNIDLEKLSKDTSIEITKQSNSIIDLTEIQVAEYFERKRKNFSVPLQLIGTDFQKKVWTHLLKIGYGITTTYKEQALNLGSVNAIRAVASANGANRIPIIIPCHRVIGSKGSLTGYSGGVWRKKFLLELESQQYQLKL